MIKLVFDDREYELKEVKHSYYGLFTENPLPDINLSTGYKNTNSIYDSIHLNNKFYAAIPIPTEGGLKQIDNY